MRLSKLVMIRGISGSGKTPVAKALQHRLGRNIMVISQDAVRRDTLHVKDGRDTKALSLLSELEKWRHEKDYMEIIPEKTILQDMSLANAVEMMIKGICGE
jgi:broad-specificity NMP kinase